MNKRTFIIIAGAIVIPILVVLALFRQFNPVLELAVVPTDAKIMIDGHAQKAGAISLSPGSHTITLSRDDFNAKTIHITMKARESITQTITLTPKDDTTAQDWAKNNPTQVQEGEGASGAAIDAQGDKLNQKYPLIGILPYQGSDFSIDFGASPQHPGDSNYVAIFVSTASDAAKTKATNWIRSQGYNPNDYEIVYKDIQSEYREGD